MISAIRNFTFHIALMPVTSIMGCLLLIVNDEYS
jgi:hypothetical protein